MFSLRVITGDHFIISSCFFTFTSVFIVQAQIYQPKVPPLSSEVQTLLNTFQFCHFKIIMSWPQWPRDFTTELAILKHLNEKASFSLETLQLHNLSPKVDNFYFNHHKTRRLSLCFIHVYMVEQLGTHVALKMRQSESCGEKPDHFLFIEQDLNMIHLRNSFFAQALFPTFAMGLILGIINCQVVYMVCMSCYFHSITYYMNQNELKSLVTLDSVWRKLHRNLNGMYVYPGAIHVIEDESQRQPVCDGFAGNIKASWVNWDEHACKHLTLGQALNYTHIVTVKPGQHKIVSNKLQAMFSVYIFEENLKVKRQETVERKEWIPYAVDFKSFYFATVKMKPGFQASALVAPFDKHTWILLITCIFLMFIVTLVAGYKLTNFKEIFTVIIASVFEQPVPKAYRRQNLFRSEYLSICWGIWLFALLVATYAYKGKIFSFLTKTFDPIWPDTVKELVDEASKLDIFTFAWAVTGNTVFSILKRDIIREGAYVNEIQKINNDITFYYSSWEYLVAQVYSKMHKLQFDSVAQLPVNVSVPSTNFVIIDNIPTIDPLSLVLKTLTPSNAVSKPILVPGYTTITPWWVSRNFIYPIFVSALAKLYESGIPLKVHLFSLEISRRIYLKQVDEKIKTLFKRNDTGRDTNVYYFLSIFCCDVSTKLNDQTASKLSLGMLRFLFGIVGILLGSACMVMLYELWAKCIKKYFVRQIVNLARYIVEKNSFLTERALHTYTEPFGFNGNEKIDSDRDLKCYW